MAAKRSAAGRDSVDSTIVWLGRMILLCIPLIGLIVYIIWAFSGGNCNRRNFARATLLLMVLAIIFAIVFAVLFQGIITPYLEKIQENGFSIQEMFQ